MVIVVTPAPEDLAGMSKGIEHFFIEAFVAELAIEALDEAVLLRLSRREVVPFNLLHLHSPHDRHADEFGAVTPAE